MEKIYIIGHKNPDTDSVTSAIALSYLKNKQGYNTEPRVLGEINKETKYVLDYFGFSVPKHLDDVKVQIEDIPYDRELMINENASIYEAYQYMINSNITGLPVVDNSKKFLGYVSLKEIATDQILGDFDNLNASYDNILKVIDGKEILRFDTDISGDIFAATYSSEAFIDATDFKNDAIVIVGNRKKVINYCIDEKVKLIIMVGGHKPDEEQIAKAKKNKVNIISTKKMSFEISKIIGLSNYIKTILRNETPVVFNPKDYLTDFLEVSNKLKHTNYPIVDNKNISRGMLRLLDINNYNKKRVILVDHNEMKQSVDGLSEAIIEEVIDHHALGNLTTTMPISFRNMIVGSTNTILYKLYKEAQVRIPREIAGIMLSGILSDTLILKSPTTTPIDVEAAKALAKKANVDLVKYGMDMIKAGSNLDGLSIEDIVFYDYKEFSTDDIGYGISQILTLDYKKILDRKDEFVKFLDKTSKTKGFRIMALFITDDINEGSYIIFSTDSKKILSMAFNINDIKEGEYLEGIISRKKQIVPVIMGEIEDMD